MPKLVIINKNKEQVIVLQRENSIGRHGRNSIQIDDPRISNSHCILRLDEKQQATIEDLESSNGTYINRKPIKGTVTLRNGDEVLVGGTRCTFDAEIPEFAEKMVRVTKDAAKGQIHSQVARLQPDRFSRESEVTDEKVLREDYEKLRVTYELQRDIGLELNIDRILEQILERANEFLNYDRGVILLKNEGGQLRPRAYKNVNPAKQMTISSTMIQRVEKEKVGVLSSDAQADTRFDGAESIIVQGVRSTMAVPILHQDELLGIMLVDSLIHVNAYTEKDLHLLTNIANQTGQLIKNSQMAKKIESDAVTRERFQRLLSPDLAEMVVSGRLKVEKGGESRVATVLFADIRGFTSMSENMPATEVLRMLNDYYEVIVDRVFRHEGTVDKYMGDGIMVLWGAPVKHKNDPLRAVRAAIDIQNVIADFNLTRQAEGSTQIEIGIGINTGNLVAGYIGSSQTMSYSVVGDAVNIASRLCSAADEGQIIISHATFESVKDYFQIKELDPIQPKGKSKPMRIYSVMGIKI